MAIAVFWAIQGAWVILPFAGLEVGLLAFLTYKVCLETYHKQVLYVRENEIEVEWGQSYPKKRWLYQRDESEFVITKPRHSLSASGLMLRHKSSHKDIDSQEPLPIGPRLNKEDMDDLIDRIKSARLAYRIRGKTTIVAIDGFDIS